MTKSWLGTNYTNVVAKRDGNTTDQEATYEVEVECAKWECPADRTAREPKPFPLGRVQAKIADSRFSARSVHV